MAGLKVYDIKECTLNFGGVDIGEGLVSFQVEPEGDAFDDDSSADGMVTRWATHENRVNGTLILKGASSDNEKLSAVINADVSIGNGAGVVTINFEDQQGASVLVTDKAWIKRKAGKTFGASPGDTTWLIRIVADIPLGFVVGGN
jgi:hypothetical protein